MLKDKVYLEMNIPNKFLASDKYIDFTAETMRMLGQAKSLQDVVDKIP